MSTERPPIAIVTDYEHQARVYKEEVWDDVADATDTELATQGKWVSELSAEEPILRKAKSSQQQ